MLKFYRAAKNQSRRELNQVRVRGTRDEFVSFKFQVESSETIDDLSVRISADSSNALSAEIYLIKRWSQAGVGIYQSKPTDVDELLVKDDRLPLKDGYSTTRQTWRHLFKPLHLYNAPDLPTQKHLSTVLKKGQLKWIFLKVKLPNSFGPASNFKLEFFAGNILLARLDVNAETVEFALRQHPQDFFLWFRARLSASEPQHYLSEGLYRLQLQDIYEHGFTSLLITEVDTLSAQKAISIAEEIGFERYIAFAPPLPELGKLRFSKVTPIIYTSDELDMHIEFSKNATPQNLVTYHQLNHLQASTIGALTMASLTNHTFIKRFQKSDDIGCYPDILSLYLNRNKEYFQLLQEAPPQAARLFYYWQCFMEKPNLNRVLAGIYLWKSGAQGISPYCYQHLPQYPNSPFNDFDQWEPDFHEGEINRPFKDHMTTYPTRSGIIPTLQWEGLRDGITDFKYLFTLHALLAEAEASNSEARRDLAKVVRERTSQFLARVSLSKIEINSETQIEPYSFIDATEYDDFRNQMIDDMLLLTDNRASSTGS